MQQKELIKEISKKKELIVIDELVILKALKKILKEENIQDISNLHIKAKKCKEIIKKTRAHLRRTTGLFQKIKINRKELLQDLLISKLTKNDVIPLLNSHSSTKERLANYEEIYKIIFSKVTINSIADLGCGLNPLSLPFTKKKKLNYFACDINKEEMNILNKFFDVYQKKYPLFKGIASICDLRADIPPEADLTLLYKVTDILDQNKGHKETEKLLLKLNSKYILISFPIVTMSGKLMRAPQRSWVNYLCNRLNYSVENFIIGNEIFYFITKDLF